MLLFILSCAACAYIPCVFVVPLSCIYNFSHETLDILFRASFWGLLEGFSLWQVCLEVTIITDIKQMTDVEEAWYLLQHVILHLCFIEEPSLSTHL